MVGEATVRKYGIHTTERVGPPLSRRKLTDNRRLHTVHRKRLLPGAYDVSRAGATIGGTSYGYGLGREMSSVSGKVAIVTGSSRGIGEAIARRLAIAGAKVVVTARTVEVRDQRLPGTVHTVADAIRAGAARRSPSLLTSRRKKTASNSSRQRSRPTAASTSS